MTKPDSKKNTRKAVKKKLPTKAAGKRAAKARVKQPLKKSQVEVISENPLADEGSRVIERPDGIYWQTKDGAREYGPFATVLEARQDMQFGDDETPEPGETLEEAEAEIGIAGWIDPDTGSPAEADEVRLEEHYASSPLRGRT